MGVRNDYTTIHGKRKELSQKRAKKGKNVATQNKRESTASQRPSKFKEKYKDRVESIQNVEAKIAENRKIAEEIAKKERASESKEQEFLKSSIERLNSNRKNQKNNK